MATAPLIKDRGEAQFVSLGVGNEVFAVPVDTVLEIVDMQPVFRVPETPAHVLGLIDLRGRSVPVLDLRASSSACRPSRRPRRRASWCWKCRQLTGCWCWVWWPTG